jgi:hypothetical protein
MQLTHGSAVGELVEAHEELAQVHHRVVAERHQIPHHESGGWHGPASFAFHRALDVLAWQLDCATDTLRVATELSTAAIVDAGGHV